MKDNDRHVWDILQDERLEHLSEDTATRTIRGEAYV